MSSALFYNFKKVVMQKHIDIEKDGLLVALMKPDFSIDLTKTQWDDISSYEVSGGNYTATAITGTVSIDGNGKASFVATGNTTWERVTLSTIGAVIYDNTTSKKYLIAWIDFGETETALNSTYTIEWNTSGIFYIN
jgi:hypothetical protein